MRLPEKSGGRFLWVDGYGCGYVNKVLCDLGPVQISSIPEAFESVLFQYSI